MNKRQKEIQQLFLDNEKEVLKKLKSNYQDALDEINSKIELLMARQDADMQHVIYRIEYQKALKDQVSAILEQLHNNEFETVSEYLAQSYENGFIGAMYDLQGQGIPLVIPIDQQQVVAAIQHETKLSKSLYTKLGIDTKDLSKKISGEISRGISSGAMYAEIARNIASWGRIPMNNAMRIARTEAHRIQIQATADAQWKAKENGADVVKQWDSALDKRTRESHRELDGQIRELDEPFEVNGHKAMQPGGFGRPEEDINCRCALLQRARWALGNDYTKWSEDAPIEIADDGTSQLAKIEAKNYKDFKEKYSRASERVRDNVQKMKKSESIEDINNEGARMLANAYENHRKSNNLSSVPYDELGESAKNIVFADYGKMSVESAKAFNDTISELAAVYDTPLQRIRIMKKQEAFGNDAFAFVFHDYTVDSAELVINPTKCKDLEKLTRRIMELSEHGYSAKIHEEMAVSYVATHEFAHTLINLEQPLRKKTNWIGADYEKIKNVRKEIKKVYDEYLEEVSNIQKELDRLFAEDINQDDIEKVFESMELISKKQDEMEKIKISEYSLENIDEFMAESFANEKLGVNSNKYSKQVVEILDKYFMR